MTDNTPPTSSDTPEGAGAKLFFVTFLAGLVLAFLMLAGRPEFLATPLLTGHGLSWLVLLLLGAGLSGASGLIYWSVPKVFGAPLYSEKIVFLHYGFHVAGTLLALASILRPGFARGEMGMTFIACGALALGVNLVGTFRAPAKPDVASAHLAASVLWLLLAAFLGVPFVSEPALAILQGTQWGAAWLILALAGVLMNVPMGLALRATPAAMGITDPKTDAAWYGLFLTNGALAWMFSATTFGMTGFLLLCAAVYLAGLVINYGAYHAVLARRTTRGLPWDTKILLTSFVVAPVAAGVLMFAAWERFSAPVPEEIPGVVPVVEEEVAGPLPVEYQPVDGALVLLALLAVAIPAMVALGFQILRTGRREHGTDQALRIRLGDQILLASFFNYATGVLLVIPGAWAAITPMLGLGSLFLVVGAAGFLGNFVFLTSRHPWVRALASGPQGTMAVPATR
jgi:hypothetical protein